MLWSLLKIVVFIALVGALAFGADFLADSDAGLRIAFGGFELNLGPLQAVILGLILIGAVWLLLKLAGLLVALLRFFAGDETALTRYFNRNRERKGYEALSDSMMALATGESRLAMTKANRAERYLGRPELTNLLIAQAAELAGDQKRAEGVYKALLADDKTRFVGVRGLMRQKLSEGNTETALKLAEHAFALKPAHEEVQDTLLQLQADNADWKNARKTLDAKLKHGTLPRDVHRRRDATLALSEAREILKEGNEIEAREAAIEANRLSPDLIPAATMAAMSYIEQGKARYAARVLKKAWGAQPHPDLAAAFAAIAPDETPAQRIRRFGQITKIAPDHAETKMLLAELHIAAEDFPAARRALGKLPEDSPTARVLTLMAAIERGEGAKESVVRGWLTRALNAPRGYQWICDKCGTIHADWGPVCSNCAAFDTISWKEAPLTEVAMPKSTEMLPLIVGAIEDARDEGAEAQAEDPPVDVEVAEVVEETPTADTPDTPDEEPPVQKAAS